MFNFQKAYGIFCLLLLVPSAAQAQHIVEPSKGAKGSTSFAVFTDEATYASCQASLTRYKEVLESEGLPTFIVYNTWSNPEQVKAIILELYKSSQLEGVVLIGDIPIPMIRKAQHLTSAFKMNEKTYPYHQSSVPSDRFYDDFNLKFDFIKQDSVRPHFFYYNLSASSPQQIRCSIYSARVKPSGSGSDKFKQVSSFLEKAVKEHTSSNKLNHFVSYTGNGSYSNSLTAWKAEAQTIREQIPGVFDSKSGSAKLLRYTFWDYPKEEVSNELRRDELDFVIFHEHGLPHRQYLSSPPLKSSIQEGMLQMKWLLREKMRSGIERGKSADEILKPIQESYHINSTWAAGYDDLEVIEADSIADARTAILLDDVDKIAPNARFVVFDACYNGDFREDDYIAGRYIFADGKCVSTFANSVNVLQDKSANELFGLLALGVRVGQWARLTNILESHITGDPTLRFASYNKAVDAERMVKEQLSNNELLGILSSSPYADIQNLALIKLFENGYADISSLLFKTFHTSSFSVVRFSCMQLLKKLNDKNFYEVLKKASTDTNEFTRRMAVKYMGFVGAPEFLPYIINAYINEQDAARIIFNVEYALYTFPVEDVEAVATKCFLSSHFINKEQMKAQLVEKISKGFYSTITKKIANKSASDKERMQYISSLKNVNLHKSADQLVAILKDPTEPDDIRIAMLEALAWFDMSYRKKEIVAACTELMNVSSTSSRVKEEALRTINRLK